MIVGSLLLLAALVLLARGLAIGSVAYLVASVAASLLAVVVLVIKGRRTALLRFAGTPSTGDSSAPREPGSPARGPVDDRGPAGGEVLVGEVVDRRASPTPVPAQPEPPVEDVVPEPTRPPVEDLVPDPAGPPVEHEVPSSTPPPVTVPTHAGAAPMSARTATATAVADPVDRDAPTAPESGPATDQQLIPGQYRTDEPASVEDDEEPPDEAPAEQLSEAAIAQLATLPDEVVVIDGRPRFHAAHCPVLPLYDHEPLPVSEAIELGFTPCSDCAAGSALLHG